MHKTQRPLLVITAMLALLIPNHGANAKANSPKGTLTIFVIQENRPEGVLMADAELIIVYLEALKDGDAVEVITTSNRLRRSKMTFEKTKKSSSDETKTGVSPSTERIGCRV